MIREGSYHGQHAWVITDGLIEVFITPELGGRILQIRRSGSDFLFENPNQIGQKNMQSYEGWDGIWQNYGGEKIWPAPQGWDNNCQWPGPPDPVLDGGCYSLSFVDDNQLILISPIDNFTGLQIKRCIELTKGKIFITAWFINHSNEEKSWSIWPVVQVPAAESQERRYQIFIPMSDKDTFRVLHGLVNSPQFIRTGEGLLVDYQYWVGKCGVKSSLGRIYYYDRKEGHRLTATFLPSIDGCYPDDTNIQIWTAGRGCFYSRGIVKQMIDDRDLNPPYMEIELLSPLTRLKPGEACCFKYSLEADFYDIK